MNPLIWIAAGLGAIAVVRRKHLKDDAQRLRTAATDAKTAATERIAARRGGGTEGGEDDDGGAPLDESTGGDVAGGDGAEGTREDGDGGDGEDDAGGAESASG